MRIFLLQLFLLVTVFSFAQKTDTVTTRWPNGRVQSVKIYANEKEHGTWMFFNDSGMLVRETNYRFGKLNGKSASFLDNGNQLSLEYFKDGLQDSMRIIWYPDGHLQADEHYKNGKPDGLCRTFSPDGHIRSTVRYVNNQMEGNFLKANEQGLTIEEGYAWHGKWVWYRKFCNNKLCEMRGLDTITGRDSIRNFDERGYMIRKEMYLKFDSLVYVQRYNYSPEGFLFSEDFSGNEKDGYYYQRHKQWAVTPDTFLLNLRVDSCEIETYYKWRIQNPGIDPVSSGILKRNEIEYFPSGKIHSVRSGTFLNLHWLFLYENGLIEEEGTVVSSQRQGLFNRNFRNENSAWVNQHSWYKDDFLYADTVFFSGGQIRKAFLFVNDGTVLSKQNQYYASGKKEQERVDFVKHGDYTDNWFYENGNQKIAATKRTDFISSREEKYEYNENGTMFMFTYRLDGHLREMLVNERDFTNGKAAELRVQKEFLSHSKGRVKYESWSENGNRMLVTKYYYRRTLKRSVVIRYGHQQRYDYNGKKANRYYLNKNRSTAEAEDYSRFSNQW